MLVVKNLTYKHVVPSISFELQPGYLYPLLGPNGSGKSTLLKLLKKIWIPTSGNVTWMGEDLHEKSPLELSRVLALAPQTPPIVEGFTVTEFVALGLYPWERLPTLSHPKIDEALRLTDLFHLKDRPIQTLSGGEKQRSYTARCLVQDTPILLLDEPTAFLDADHRQAAFLLFEHLKNQGKILLIATHDNTWAEKYRNYSISMPRSTL